MFSDSFFIGSSLVFYFQTVKDDTTVYIQNISPGDAGDLCSIWKKHSHVVNFLPLLNKVIRRQRCFFLGDAVGLTGQHSRHLVLVCFPGIHPVFIQP